MIPGRLLAIPGAALGRVAALALMMGFLALRIWDPAPLENFRLRTFDFYQALAPRVADTLPVIIVDIDEASLKRIGQWPWARTRVAELILQLQRSRAVALGMDVIFSEPDRLSPGAIADAVQEIDEATRDRLRGLPSNDEILARSFTGLRTVLAQSGQNDPAIAPLDDTAIPIAIAGPDPSRFLVNFPGLLTNVPVLEKAAAGRGLFTLRPDQDGIVRQVPVVMVAAGRVRLSLTLELLRVATQSDTLLVRADKAGMRDFVVGGVKVPTDANGRIWLHFSPHDPRRFVSAADVLEGKVGERELAGKLVLLGTSAIGLLDNKTTPLDAAMPGVEVHAQLLENILNGTQLKRPSYLVGAEIVLALGIALLIIVLVPWLGARSVLVIGFLIAVNLSLGSVYLFRNRGVLMDVVYPLLSSFGVFWTLVFVNYFNEQTQRRQIRSAFAQYLSPALVERLAQHPEQLKLGGEAKELTILFSDVRNFTSLAETYKSNPQGLTQLVNRLLTPLSNIVVENGGTIDKYMGDNVMAFWNAPLDDAAHAGNACRAACGMLAAVTSLNGELRETAKQNGTPFIPIAVGIGINTGECVVGNMGSDIRFDYTVLGDSVNLASRLEGQTKYYGAPIIIGERTNMLVEERFYTVPIDIVRVKGKSAPERIHALLSPIGDGFHDGGLKARLGEALAAYHDRKWSTVLRLLQLSEPELAKYGVTGIEEIYAGRIRDFEQSPPPPDWDGVFDATSK